MGSFIESTASAAAEKPGDSTPERAQQAFHGTRRALFEGAAVNRTELFGHRIAVLEELDVHGAAVDRPQIRYAAQLLAVDARRRFELARRQRLRGPLHELGPDRQRHARAVRVGSDCRGLSEPDPHTDDYRCGEADEPGVVVI